MPTAHITLRMSRDLLTAIENAAAGQGQDRSKWIKARLREGLSAAPLPDSSAPDLPGFQEFIEVDIPTLREHVAALQAHTPVLDAILKLCIEAVMIGRQLALKQGEPVLHLAQTNARDYYNRASLGSPKSVDRAFADGTPRGSLTEP
jgi:hypothetical protein